MHAYIYIQQVGLGNTRILTDYPPKNSLYIYLDPASVTNAGEMNSLSLKGLKSVQRIDDERHGMLQKATKLRMDLASGSNHYIPPPIY